MFSSKILVKGGKLLKSFCWWPTVASNLFFSSNMLFRLPLKPAYLGFYLHFTKQFSMMALYESSFS